MGRLFHDVVSGTRTGTLAAAARAGLAMASMPYGLAVTLRNWRFDRGVGVQTLGRPTLGVGNLTVGGTGKTPVVAALCRILRDNHHTPAVLSRGYGGTRDTPSDETRLLGELLGPGVPLACDPSRLLAARRTLEAHPHVTCFVLDDGFQHRRARRDFDLVLIDATDPLGQGRLLPRGLLREQPHNLRRADAVLVTRCDVGDAAHARRLVREALGGTHVPVYDSRFEIDAGGVRGRPALAACGIGNPDAFLKNLDDAGVDVRLSRIFPDHYAYTRHDADGLARLVPAGGVLVTTGKDWVKLRQLWPPGVPAISVAQRVLIEGEAGLLASVLGSLA